VPVRAPGWWPRVRQIIEAFEAQGCELRTLDQPAIGPYGSYEVRFMYNPATEGFVPLRDLQDDEIVPPSEVDHWERRLGMEVPKPGNTH